jgi:hypothetical protein
MIASIVNTMPLLLIIHAFVYTRRQRLFPSTSLTGGIKIGTIKLNGFLASFIVTGIILFLGSLVTQPGAAEKKSLALFYSNLRLRAHSKQRRNQPPMLRYSFPLGIMSNAQSLNGIDLVARCYE